MATADALNWDDLRYFLAAARSGTLAGAARALEVEHSTIGRRLSALERAMGAPLVIRGPTGLHLTPLGETLVPLAEQVESAVLDLHDRGTRGHSRVRLAMPTGFTRLFASHLARLRASNPQLTLELLTGTQAVDLAKGEADLAIRTGPIADQSLIARPLGEAGWSLYASPTYLTRHAAPRVLDDLRGHEVIGYDPALADLPAARWIEQRLHGAAPALRSREMTDMLAAALNGAGLAALPCVIADPEPGLVRITPTVLGSRPLSLVYPREARLSPSVQAVVRFVLEVMRDNAAQVAGTSNLSQDTGGHGRG